jgi:hypothetical protein
MRDQAVTNTLSWIPMLDMEAGVVRRRPSLGRIVGSCMFLPVPVPTVSSPTTPGMQPYAKAQTRGTRVAGRCACRADHPLFGGKHTTKTTLSAVHRACLRTTARTGGGAGGERGYTDTRTALRAPDLVHGPEDYARLLVRTLSRTAYGVS